MKLMKKYPPAQELIQNPVVKTQPFGNYARELVSTSLLKAKPTLAGADLQEEGAPATDGPLFVKEVTKIENSPAGARCIGTQRLELVLKLPKQTFRLEDLYASIQNLRQVHPLNNNIDAKIRQQLQVLRDLNLVEFIDQRGTYRKRWPLA